MLHSVYLASVTHLFFLHVLDGIDLGHLYICANKNFALFPSAAFQSVPPGRFDPIVADKKFSEPCWDGQHWSASRLSFCRGFSRASGPRASVHSTLRALWAQLAVGYVSAWRPSVISHCQDQQEWDGCLLMSGRDSYSCLFSPIHLLQTSLLSLLRGVREFFVFSDQGNLQFHSPKLWNERSAALSNLNLVFSYREGSLAFSDAFFHDLDLTLFETVFLTLVLRLMRVRFSRFVSQSFTADLHCTSRWNQLRANERKRREICCICYAPYT